MAAYMKTEMPFYGVKSPGRKQVLGELAADFPVEDVNAYRTSVAVLWRCPHREEKNLAVTWARRWRTFITPDNLDLYERLIVEGAWWDFVDEVAAHLVGKVLLDHPGEMTTVMYEWVESPDMWKRRTAILSQLRHGDATDEKMLFEFCLARCEEREFFIRKAIGWALRQYARTDPDAVRRFAVENRTRLSGLSFREATKHLDVA